ncbi:CAP domain-containing protein [Streptomyces sp. RerS4]|uniref:CAP domain-containing protein n=1 Tax=Streptomyces sp. RerS4 TaxID=2942449 RepID=UPI00201C6F86|nr:CAP domain-containing protein [Streptomyces sp. RerS4]UQW99523.1 CAP domain-containing protein [Streptomyces sp. RerS4]
MRKHRKKTRHKKIAVAVGALAIVGVPTAAMACLGPQDTGPTRNVSRQESLHRQDVPVVPPSFPAPATTPSDSPVASDGSGDADAPATPVADSRQDRPQAEAPRHRAPAAVRTQAAPAPAKPAPATPAPEAPAPEAPAADAPSSDASVSGAAARVLELVNKERAAVQCPALTINDKLTKAAQDHSADMAAHGNMSHTGSDGSDAGQRITRAGYTWRTYGENVAYGYSTPEQVMEGWMSSPGHKRNILDCSYKEIGIGLAQPNHYWTQNFGASR